MRSSIEIKKDISFQQFQIRHAHDDELPDLQGDLESLFEELDEAEEAEADKADKGRSAYSGLDLVKVAKAFGMVPKDWDEGFL